ncbi:MAG: sensor histidine kinase [Rhizobacter sp.]
MAAASTGWDNAVRVALWSIGLIAPFGLVAGLAAFRWVTRPLTQLTQQIDQLEQKERHGHSHSASADSQKEKVLRDEIVILRQAFERLVATNADQWQRLNKQDQQRRELIASLSHDLRSPLASLHGYLETLLMKSARLDDADRDRYLRSALAQSRSVAHLASELLELAQMELGMVKPVLEHFSLVELAQDVIQKLELSASSRNQRIATHFAASLPDVCADIGMIERVLTNLLDNAIRHSPAGGDIQVSLQADGDRVCVEISDSGAGIDPALRSAVFLWPMEREESRNERPTHGLGLAIVRQMLQLHGSLISLRDQADRGAVFVFTLSCHSSQEGNGKDTVIKLGTAAGIEVTHHKR